MKTMNMIKNTETSDDDRVVRRVQVTGRGSYIVSIPKNWVESAGLEKGAESNLADSRIEAYF